MIEVKNMPEGLKDGFITVSSVGGILWYFSTEKDYEKALIKAAKNNKVVLALGEEPGYIKPPKKKRNGKRITDSSARTTTFYYEISKEEYERITSLPRYKKELDRAYDDESIICGYGFYGCDVVEREDGYFYTICRGNSCD